MQQTCLGRIELLTTGLRQTAAINLYGSPMKDRIPENVSVDVDMVVSVLTKVGNPLK